MTQLTAAERLDMIIRLQSFDSRLPLAEGLDWTVGDEIRHLLQPWASIEELEQEVEDDHWGQLVANHRYC